MQSLKILNNKEKKPILALIKKQWGAGIEEDYAFLMSNKDRIYIVNKDISRIDQSKLRINSLGLYLGELRNNEIRLSIEGAQIIGPKATKNVVDIENPREWLRGSEVETEGQSDTFVIVKNNNDFLGSGKIKDGKILNFVGKNRRLNA